jgi:hypothetical protein
VQDLSLELTKTIEEFEQRFPNLSSAEIRQAAQLAVQRKASGSGVNRQAIAVGVGLAAFLAGVAVFMTQSGSLENVEVPWMMIGIGVTALIGLAVFLLRQNE